MDATFLPARLKNPSYFFFNSIWVSFSVGPPPPSACIHACSKASFALRRALGSLSRSRSTRSRALGDSFAQTGWSNFTGDDFTSSYSSRSSSSIFGVNGAQPQRRM
eukprot:30844-Pelagococcus_subviridis.AAC.6